MNKMKLNQRAAVAAALALACGLSAATDRAKDVVIDRVSSPVVNASPAAAGDAMSVSVLLEAPDGSLTPKSTDVLFRTGDRFRIKVLGSRDSRVSLFNTNPRGELGSEPVWRGELRQGQELITPRLALTGNSGVDQLHVVMEPVQESGLFAWVSQWLRSLKEGGGASKDIRVDVQSTPTTTYIVNEGGQGLVTTIKIAHSR
ncbi:hypothetical protein [Roseateles sp. LYH14W]|uniref:DUF4384 domain-containing protein n=1 Tax=Pelomonas parva TaxID=3299032 RepID=A0ABW7F9G1_9BURK